MFIADYYFFLLVIHALEIDFDRNSPYRYEARLSFEHPSLCISGCRANCVCMVGIEGGRWRKRVLDDDREPVYPHGVPASNVE